jgi:LmbE family N-acetylglucosaminyl deacetylase
MAAFHTGIARFYSLTFAHPDDIEFGCAGTVARWVSEGAHATYALLTNGAAGSSDPQMTRARLAEIREAEQRGRQGARGGPGGVPRL